MAKFTKVNEELLAEQIEDQIYDMIVSENYQTGDKIPSENKLSVRFNVGRSTIREAIKILVSRNVLTTVRGSGTYVKNIIPSDMDPLNLRDLEDRLSLAMDLVELRMMLEPGVAELAAMHATDEQVQELEGICNRVEYKIQHNQNYINDDIELHTAIAKCARNKVMEQLIYIIETAVMMFVNVTHKKLIHETIETHRAVVDAIRKHDTIGARSAMAMHMTYNRNMIRQMLEEKAEKEKKRNDENEEIE